MQNRRLIATTLSIFLIVGTHLEGNAAKRISPEVQQLGMYLDENLEFTAQTSGIYATSTPDVQASYKLCKTITDEICTEATDIAINQYFDICAGPSEINCIQEVWAKRSDGEKIAGVYQRHIPSSGSGDFPAAPAMKLPASKGNNLLIRFPGVNHSGGSDDFLVGVRNSHSFRKPGGASALIYPIEAKNLVGAIAAVTPLLTGQQGIQIFDGFSSNGGLEYSPAGDRCLSTGDGYCAAARYFPADYRFGLTLKLSNKLNGWFHGRISKPEVSTRADGDSYLVTIEATPVRVATLDFMVPISEVDQRIKNRVLSAEDIGHAGDERSGVRLAFDLNFPEGPELLDWFSPNFKDKATRTNEYWTFRTLTDFRNDSLRRCSNDSGELAGVVTTNALLYSSGPPTYNSSEGTLDYQVAAPHYESNGNEASGTYDLLLRSDVARCIYGFTQAPIKASIEVLSADGTAKVATTLISEKDGWLSLSAGGFGFSSPIVRAKLSQDSPEPETPSSSGIIQNPGSTSTPTAEVVSKKVKKSITCVKGASKKKVNGVKPKCPKGWKRAA